MTYEEFWNKVIITEEEKKKSVHYLQYRGVDEHDHVRQHLESLSGEKVSYAEIATAFRYDKRIRRVLYKYIGLLEESIRAFISNKYSDNIDRIRCSAPMKTNLNKFGTFSTALSELTFYQLITQVLMLSEKDKKEIFSNYRKPNDLSKLTKDLYAIVALRNEVSHNRFLLDNKNLKKCSVGDGNGSIWTNIINLKNCLPEPFRIQFTTDINDCAKEGKIDYSNQTQWVLINALIVSI
ncbi:MAG: hypothetical protein IJR66_02660 [Clostridia bacterium]|nr:hypothetical protein [Clostridia bacterium]